MERTELFGGAITVNMPHNFVDISNFREIPDHQEVYGNIDTDQSIIIEVLSTPSWPNEVSAEYHFKDLAETNDCNNNEDSIIHQISPIVLPNFQGMEIYSCVLYGTQRISKFKENAKNVVNIYLCLIRIPKVQTDLLITYNEPTQISEESSSFQSIDPSQFNNRLPVLPYFHEIALSLKIEDWNLFA